MLKRLLRYLPTLMFLFVGALSYAQSSMTDEQIKKFIIKETNKGSSQQEVVTKLIQQGVSIEQIRKLRDKMKKETGGSLGAKNLTDKETSSSRLRKGKSGEKQKKTEDYKATEDMSEKEKKELSKRQEEDYTTETDIFFPDSLLDEMARPKKEVFGRNIFNNKNLSFEPNMNIATPSNYRLGPGDAVFIDIWGASQKTIESSVSPEGAIDIEGYGPVAVSGLTVAEANARLRNTLGSRFANSKIKLTVGETKTIMVNVMGEVKTPGTYTLSAFASVFHALYMAGGINDIGTLRNIKVYRNNRLVTSVDIYDYILNGKLSGNVRLTDNDVIVVGAYDCLVNVAGKVKRPMYYEMKKTESVGTLIKYAGGFAGDAYDKSVRLIRKSGGEYSIFSIDEFTRNTFKVSDGDSLTVDSLIPRYSNMVEVKGAVFRPGMYQMNGSIRTVRELIESAGGLQEDAFTPRAVMHRRKADRTLEVISVDMEGLLSNKIADIPLANEDVIFIPSKKDAQEEQTLTIKGEVQYPGLYDYAENTTIEDLILQAGGLKDAASLVKVDISRRIRDRKAVQSEDNIARFYSLSIKDGFVVDGTPGFKLQPFDEIFIRKSPGYVEQQHVTVLGEVTFTGDYTLTKKTSRLSDIIKDAGGLTSSAYAEGARLERRLTYAEKLRQQSLLKMLDGGDSISVKKLELGDSRYIGINLSKALENPGNNNYDLVLEDGDRLIIPQFSNTVSINGDVMYPTSVIYKKNANLSYYINQAGGYGVKAKPSKVFVIQMNGTVTKVKSAKDLTPGCEIVVPSKPKRKGMSLPEIMTLGTSAASLASIVAMLISL